MKKAYKVAYACPYCGSRLSEQQQKLVCPDCGKKFYLYETIYLSKVS